MNVHAEHTDQSLRVEMYELHVVQAFLWTAAHSVYYGRNRKMTSNFHLSGDKFVHVP